MKRLLALLLILVASPFLSAQEKGEVRGKGDNQPKVFTKTVQSVWRPVDGHPLGGHFVHFMDRWSFNNTVRAEADIDPSKLPPAPDVIDWFGTTSLPTDLNDTYGDCYYAALCHWFNSAYGSRGSSVAFGLSAIKSRYFTLSGGDNGLSDPDVQGEMMSTSRPYQGFVADVQGTGIVDFMYVDTSNPDAMARAMWSFGPLFFTFNVAGNWISNSGPGFVWDASTFRSNNNGHAIVFGGRRKNKDYSAATWGVTGWITQAGVDVCDPGGWVAFSVKWFDAKGYAPNKMHIVDLAKYWQAAGGKAIPQSVISAFPPPGNVPPDPVPVPPGPTPVGNDSIKIIVTQGGKITETVMPLMPAGAIVWPADTPKWLKDAVEKQKQFEMPKTMPRPPIPQRLPKGPEQSYLTPWEQWQRWEVAMSAKARK